MNKFLRLAFVGTLAAMVALPAAASINRAGILALTAMDDSKFADSVNLRFGNGTSKQNHKVGDVTMRWDGTDFDVLAAANNSVIKWGNGTNSFDQWLYGSSTSNYLLWDASANDLIFQDSVSAIFGTGLDAELRWDGTDLDLLAAADDSVFKIGNGTNSWDLWLYGNTASDYVLWDASADLLSFKGGADATFDAGAVLTVAGTADITGTFKIGSVAVTSTAAELNNLAGVTAGAVTASKALVVGAGSALTGLRQTILAKTANFTPNATDSGTVYMVTGGSGITATMPAVASGVFYSICNQVNQDLTISASPDLLVALNNAAASTIALSTTNEKIGGCIDMISDGTKWIAAPRLDEAQTVTVVD